MSPDDNVQRINIQLHVPRLSDSRAGDDLANPYDSVLEEPPSRLAR